MTSLNPCILHRNFVLQAVPFCRRPCSNPAEPCALKPTHKHAILIDSLRFDSLSPAPPELHSPCHHNSLAIPRELTTTELLLNFHADPPTVTVERTYESSRRGLFRRHRPQLWRRVHCGGISYTGSSRTTRWRGFP